MVRVETQSARAEAETHQTHKTQTHNVNLGTWIPTAGSQQTLRRVRETKVAECATKGGSGSTVHRRPGAHAKIFARIAIAVGVLTPHAPAHHRGITLGLAREASLCLLYALACANAYI